MKYKLFMIGAMIACSEMTLAATVYLSDLTPTAITNGWGPYERDLSNGEDLAGDGHTLTINGTTYAKGLGVHAISSLTYSLGGLYSRFQSFIGVDDEITNDLGSVSFRVLADGVEIFTSGTFTGATGPHAVDLDVAGRQALRLIVDDLGSDAYDHADWADAKVITSDLDSDGDGILDSVDPDDDNDGMSDADEAVAGTNPTNRLSVLRLTDSVPHISNSQFEIRWQSVSNHRYTVQATTNLLSGFTLNLFTNIAATYPVNVYTDNVSGVTCRFYRVIIATGAVQQMFGWQVNETTVGLAPLGIVGSNLQAYTGPSEIPSNSVISGMRFTGNISLHQGNITIENCSFRPTGAGRGMPLVTTTDFNTWEPGHGKVIIRDCEFDGTLLDDETAAWATGFWGIADLQRNYFHHFGGGFALYNSGTNVDVLMEHNYVTDLLGIGDPATTGNHSDAFTIRDFTDAARSNRVAIIRNNRFDCDSPNATGAFFIQALSGRIDNITIEGNLLEGNGWNLVLEYRVYGYSNVSVSNNRFAPGLLWWAGAAYSDGGEGWTTWQENYLYDPAQPDGKGAVVNQ